LNKLILRAFTLAAVLIFSIGACVYVVIDGEQYYFKALAGDEIQMKGKLETIKVPLKECNGKIASEIWENGSMYDVSSYVVLHDTAVVTVYHDNREEELVHMIADNFECSDSFGPGIDHHISKYRSHITDDGKILREVYALKISTAPAPVPAFYEQAVYPSDQTGSVTTPPPDVQPC